MPNSGANLTLNEESQCQFQWIRRSDLNNCSFGSNTAALFGSVLYFAILPPHNFHQVEKWNELDQLLVLMAPSGNFPSGNSFRCYINHIFVIVCLPFVKVLSIIFLRHCLSDFNGAQVKASAHHCGLAMAILAIHLGGSAVSMATWILIVNQPLKAMSMANVWKWMYMAILAIHLDSKA